MGASTISSNTRRVVADGNGGRHGMQVGAGAALKRAAACSSAEVSKVSEVHKPKMRTAEITSYQIISGRTNPVYPPPRGSDEIGKPCIAVDAVKTNGK